jgi:hypothetical protein
MATWLRFEEAGMAAQIAKQRGLCENIKNEGINRKRNEIVRVTVGL